MATYISSLENKGRSIVIKLILGIIIFVSGSVLLKKAISRLNKYRNHHTGEGTREAAAKYQIAKRDNSDTLKENETEQEFVYRFMKENNPKMRTAILIMLAAFILMMPGCGMIVSGLSSL